MGRHLLFRRGQRTRSKLSTPPIIFSPRWQQFTHESSTNRPNRFLHHTRPRDRSTKWEISKRTPLSTKLRLPAAPAPPPPKGRHSPTGSVISQQVRPAIPPSRDELE